MSETFALDISSFAKKFGIAADTAARKLVLDIQRDVMLATPVDTGLLRSSWFVGIGGEPGDTPATPDQGAAAKAQAVSTLAGFRWGDTVYLTNNQVYAYPIEFLGHSKVKAPAGMLRVTVARYQAAMGRWA
jgi:hypothetical protein